MFKIQFFLLIFLFLITISSLINSEQIKKEFVINDYIKLKLENGRTSIYVKNRVFRQCMYLLLNISVKKIEEYDDIESIDEAAEKLDRSLEGRHSSKGIISPEEEFKGHCSNIQAWAENDYDTRILHRNLAFPLLKRLSEVGDPLAKKKIKEEIAIRYASGYPSVTTFLTKNGYLKYLNSEEIACLIDDQNLPIIKKITEKLKLLIGTTENDQLERPILSLIKKLSQNFGLHNLPFIISRIIKKIPEDSKQKIVKIVYNEFENNKKFPLIEFLNYTLEFFTEIKFEHVTYQDKLIGIIRNKTLNLTQQDIESIVDIKGLENKYSTIEELDLSHNRIREIKGLEKFINLKVLNLNYNQITQIEGLDHLKKMQKLFLRNNKISEIKGLDKMMNIEHVDLSNNKNIHEISDSLNRLPALKIFKLLNCGLSKFSESISKFFWMEQNYRYFSNYSHEDVRYYEKTHKRKAASNNQLYKQFVKWLLKMKSLMTEFKFTYLDIEKFGKETSNNVIWSGKLTNAFKKWLFDRKQTKITTFL